MAREITLNHICKIEGHASLTLEIDKNKVKKCELKASEGARFFEALVLGRNINDIQEIVSRICGICSCSHSVASVQALEEALEIKTTNQQKFIREILVLGERIRSHATHLYFMSLPDYLGASSVLTLKSKHKEKVNDALKIITAGNKLVEKFGGREMHPFLKIEEDIPNEDFSNLITRLKQTKPFIIKTIKLFSSLPYHNLKRQTQYSALKKNSSYATISGKVSLGKDKFIDDDYKHYLTESIKEYATSKFVLHDDTPFSLGAIARISNNSKQLDKETKEQLNNVLKRLKITLPVTNPYHNLVCQSLEILQATNRAISLLELPPTTHNPQPTKISNFGTGISAVEAPRGTLFHEYKISKEGTIDYCNIITPTTQALNMMELDIISLVNKLLMQKAIKEEIVNQIEKLIRAYDPCFSCSTHFLKVNWK